MTEERSPAKPDAGTKKPIVSNPSTPGVQTPNTPSGREAPADGASRQPMARAKRPPTDFELLKAIYAKHRSEYIAYAEGARAAKVMVPIDIPSIANELDADVDSVFGRLYYHLDPQYAQEPDPTVGRRGRKSFFSLKAGDDTNCINFPLLEAVLAGLWQQRRRDLFAVVTSVVSLVIATTSLGVAIFSATS